MGALWPRLGWAGLHLRQGLARQARQGIGLGGCRCRAQDMATLATDKMTEKEKWKERQLRNLERKMRLKKAKKEKREERREYSGKEVGLEQQLRRLGDEGLAELWRNYLENLELAVQEERVAAQQVEGRQALRLPEAEMEVRGLAVCGLTIDRAWGARPHGLGVRVRLRKAAGALPVGGWRRGMLLDLQVVGGEGALEQWRRKEAILVEMTTSHAIVTIDNLNSWVLDTFTGGTREQLVVKMTKRSDDENYARDIRSIKGLGRRGPDLSPETPLGFVARAVVGWGEERVETWAPSWEEGAAPRVTVYSQQVREDSSKMAALARVAARPAVSIMHGPPGTGKTTALAAAVLHTVAAGERVLVAAPSHAACDAATLALAAQWPGGEAAAGGGLVRLGNKLRLTNTRVEAYLPGEHREGADWEAGREWREGGGATREQLERLEEQERRLGRLRGELVEGGRGRQELVALEAKAVKEGAEMYRQLEEIAMEGASVVVCTLATAGRPLLLDRVQTGHFGLVCIDEAGFTQDPPLLPLLTHARRLLLAGDHLQLPPVVLSSGGKERGLSVSLLERLCRARPKVVSLLDTQYRSHPAISAWSSRYFYSGRLAAAPLLENRTLGGLVRGVRGTVWGNTPLLWLDTAGQGEGETGGAGGQSISNMGEALVVVELVEELVGAGVEEAMVGVISPYWAQAGLIRSLVWEGAGRTEVEVRTVDGYQGREKEVIIVSLVRSNSSASVGFLEESRRLNVAVTRARRMVVLVGDSATLATDPAIANLLEFCRSQGAVRELKDMAHMLG